ncbi:MAG: bifunctional adenosylcobinamide kinase/adenosylcobinamide-phosphate guanylyltransferase [Firmicutes bacterium]|jgi:adenosylcobinamide kinase/adenosylcobinamide-phosphate guanylyltransferase|nr:bifunctional adenosylcobinamide kinase/adenosylcobinamide-phosphate guanylyltransferase [Bacillota bacterium]
MEDTRGKLILVTGGARSGKSTFAENYAREASKRVVYIATAAGDDEEMRRRIAAHRQRRPKHFITIEERYYPHLVLEKEGRADTFILLDCLTLLLSNHLIKEAFREGGAERNQGEILDDAAEQERVMERILDYIGGLSLLLRSSPADVLVVTNEVGMGLVPEYPLSRVFRDLSGRANQIMASRADEVWFTVCGIPQRIK